MLSIRSWIRTEITQTIPLNATQGLIVSIMQGSRILDLAERVCKHWFEEQIRRKIFGWWSDCGVHEMLCKIFNGSKIIGREGMKTQYSSLKSFLRKRTSQTGCVANNESFVVVMIGFAVEESVCLTVPACRRKPQHLLLQRCSVPCKQQLMPVSCWDLYSWTGQAQQDEIIIVALTWQGISDVFVLPGLHTEVSRVTCFFGAARLSAAFFRQWFPHKRELNVTQQLDEKCPLATKNTRVFGRPHRD